MMRRSQAYSRWHEHKYHQHHHWLIALVAFAVSAYAMVGAWQVTVNEMNRIGLENILPVVHAQIDVPCTGDCVNVSPTGRYADPIFPTVSVQTVTYSTSIDENGIPENHMADIYTPDGDTEVNRPLIIWIPGGGFSSADRARMTIFANEFAKKGYVAAAIDYRVREGQFYNGNEPELKCQVIPEAQSDAQAAVRWFRQNAATYGIDTNNIIIAGGSAGAITAVHVGYNADHTDAQGLNNDPGNIHPGCPTGAWPRTYIPNTSNPSFPADVIAVVDISGALGDENGITDGEMVAGDPPIIIFHGSVDTRVSYTEAQELETRALATGVPYEFHTFLGQGHGLAACCFTTIALETTDFLYRHVINATQPITNPPPNSPDVDPTTGQSPGVEGSTTSETTPSFTFIISDSAPEPGEMIGYRIQISRNSTFTDIAKDYTWGGSTTNNNTVTFNIQPQDSLTDGPYWWRVRTVDSFGNSSSWTDFASPPTQTTPDFIVSSVVSCTYIVAQSGTRDFDTIQQAADVVASGDVVCVRAGTYAGFHIKDKHGAPYNQRIVFRSYPGDTAVIDSALNTAGFLRGVEISGSSYIDIKDFEITDSTYYDPGLTDEEKYNIGKGRNGIKLNVAGALYGDSSFIRLMNNKIHYLGDHGIIAETGDNNEIISNHIYDVGVKTRTGYGMYVHGNNMIIRGNQVENAYGYGIHFYSGQPGTGAHQNAIIEDNIVFSNGHADYLFRDSGGNLISKVLGDGILVWVGSQHQVRNNLVYDNFVVGINVNADNSLIVNNTVYNSKGSSGLYIYDNRGVAVKNNLLFNNPIGDLYYGLGNSACTNNLYITKTGSGGCQQSIQQDPLLADPANSDFHLTASSPAIDAGTTQDAPSTDFEGTPRPQGAGIDIGADEFGAGAVNNPPTVTWDNPVDLETVSGSVTLSVTASDPDTGDSVTGVNWCYVAGANNCTPTTAMSLVISKWTSIWSTASLTDGQYSLCAQATDSQNAKGPTKCILVNVDNSTAQPPDMAWSQPTPNSTISGIKGLIVNTDTTAASVTWCSTAGAPSCIPIISMTGSGNNDVWTYSWDTTGVSNDVYVLCARATGINGATNDKCVQNITVNNIAVNNPPNAPNLQYLGPTP